MKSRPSPNPLSGFVEPLESRIAPARIILVGLPDHLRGEELTDTNYREVDPAKNLFVNISEGQDSISQALGGDTADPNAYYLRLGAGDQLRIFNGLGGFEEYLVVGKGNVVAYFIDKPGPNNAAPNGEIDEGELIGLSLGKNASIELRGSIAGDIVANLDEKGTKGLADDTIDMTGLVSHKQAIARVKVGGDVGGSIIAGGNIQRVDVTGNVFSILTGTAANGRSFDLLPGVAGGSGTLEVTQAAGKAGPSINRVVVDSITDRIEAGAGGAGTAGGSLLSVRVTEDLDGFLLKAGDGGRVESGKAGSGGVVKGVYISNPADAVPNDLVSILAGAGGISDTGRGGNGGSVSEVYIGYQQTAGKLTEGLHSFENFRIEGGDGGAGKVGGKGGDVFKLNARLSTPDQVEQDEFYVRAGTGGAATSENGGAAGNGGSIKNIVVRNHTNLPDGDIVLEAGNGGITAVGQEEGAVPGAKGGAGGSITKATLFGPDFRIIAGNGSTGKVGGAGGSLTGINIEHGETNLFHRAVISAGFGGDGTGGNGGDGGQIKNFEIANGDIDSLIVNAGMQADGGNSTGGRGGRGGSITNFSVRDYDSTGNNAYEGNFTLRAGKGGDGEKGGGVGGSIVKTAYEGQDLNVDFRAGAGGQATGKGNGGAGGAVKSVSITAEGSVAGAHVTGILSAGVGGSAISESDGGAGGRGGDVRLTSIVVTGTNRLPVDALGGSVQLTAGDGGSGSNKAAGHGGSVISSGAYAIRGDGLLQAGHAGQGGTLPGNGGDVAGVSSQKQVGLFAAGELTVRAGDGSHGGSGGSIRFLGYGSAEPDLTPTPIGNILIQAGHGSAEGNKAGAGGSLVNVIGAVADGGGSAVYNTVIRAGDGGGETKADLENNVETGIRKTGGGGSITNLTLERGGHTDSVLTITAGDGGSSDEASAGGKGGSVKKVAVSNIAEGTIFRSVAAGDGGDGIRKGGIGGSITDVQVKDHDIGVRSGAAYGYDSMGGLFAGAGGSGEKAGISGNVTNVTALAIASIVAGKGEAPELVTKVDRIIVGAYTARNGIVTDLLDQAEGDLNANMSFVLETYAKANLVGAVYQPDRDDAYKFDWDDVAGEDRTNGKFELGDKPIDGLIASKTLVRKNLNFVPEAYFDGVNLIDHDNVFTKKPTPQP